MLGGRILVTTVILDLDQRAKGRVWEYRSCSVGSPVAREMYQTKWKPEITLTGYASGVLNIFRRYAILSENSSQSEFPSAGAQRSMVGKISIIPSTTAS